MKIMLCFAFLAVLLRQTSSLTVSDLSHAVEVGDDVTFICENGNGAINWYFEEDLATPLSPDGHYIITDGPGAKSNLTIVDVTMGDSGDYICADDNAQHTIRLEVYVIPVVVLTSNPSTPHVIPGENRTLTCDTSAYADRVQWKKNGVVLTESANIVIDNINLTIVNSALTDAGVYQCLVNISDLAKKDIVREDTFNLIAQVTVLLTQNVKLEEGETARIGCDASGYPLPTVAWYRDNKKMDNDSADDRVFITYIVDEDNELVITSKLNIRRIQSADAGEYFCNATNNHTSAGEVYMLQVRDPLAALWPFLGIMVEVIVLIILILGVEFYQKNRNRKN